MAFSINTALTGFKPDGVVGHRELLWLPGDPGVTYTQGEMCALGSAAGAQGVLIVGTDSLADAVFQVAKTTVCPAASQAFPKPGTFNPGAPLQSAANSCLVPVYSTVPAGTPKFVVPIDTVLDDTVISYTAATRAIAATTGHGADDRPTAALLYVYEGPGAGELNIIEDYDHTGGAAELLVITHRAFSATLTSASKYIVLAGEAAGDRGVCLFGRADLLDGNEIDVADGANDGDYTVYADWASIHRYISNGWLPVIRTASIYAH